MDTPSFRSFLDRCFLLIQEQDLTELDEIEQLILDEWDNELEDEWDISN